MTIPSARVDVAGRRASHPQSGLDSSDRKRVLTSGQLRHARTDLGDGRVHGDDELARSSGSHSRIRAVET